MGLEQLNLSQIELAGLREYEKSQAGSNGRSDFANRTIVQLEAPLKSARRSYRLKPDSFEKTINRRHGRVKKGIPERPSLIDYEMPDLLEDLYISYDMAMVGNNEQPSRSWSFGANGNGFLKGSLSDQLLACIQKNPGLCPGWFEETGLADSAFSITKMPV